MKKNRWVKGLSLCLTLVLLTTVGALSYDFSGDGKTNGWDLQVAINEGKTTEEKNGALREALGGKGDELHKNADGVYEIWSVVGLYNMAEHAGEGASFKLMADIDMGGADWTPVLLKGSFDGNLHTISNVKITKSVKSSSATHDMGFFSMLDQYKAGDATVQGVIKNLNLKNVYISVTENTQFVGWA